MDQKVLRVINAYLSKEAYSFSSIQCDFPKGISNEIIAWGKQNIPDADLHIDPQDSSSGRETDIHVTVKYGLHTIDPTAVQPFLTQQTPFEATLGKISLFNSDAYDVVKIDIKSPELHRLNKMISKNFEVTDTHPSYIPHITIAYLKKGLGEKFDGRNDFEGKKVFFDNITFSGKDNRLTTIHFPKEVDHPKIIACDFDGTIVENNEDIENTNFKFMPNAQKVLRWIADNFHLIIWTCRSADTLEVAKKFLDANGVKYQGINTNANFLPFSTSSKIYSDFYIDDRATIGGEIDWPKIKDFLKSKYL